MPSIRVSISVARSSRRRGDSFGAALVAPGAAEVTGSSLPALVSPPAARPGYGKKHRPRRLVNMRAAAAFSCLAPRGAGFSSVAELDRARLHTVADLRLGDPALVDDHVEVVLRDGERRQQNAVELRVARAAGERLHAFNVGALLACGEREGGLR